MQIVEEAFLNRANISLGGIVFLYKLCNIWPLIQNILFNITLLSAVL